MPWTNPLRILRLLLLQDVDEILERGSHDDAFELGPVVVDQTNVFDHKVVDFPFFADAVELVVDGQFLAAIVRDDPGVDFREVRFFDLARVEHVLTAIGFDSVRVKPAQ